MIHTVILGVILPSFAFAKSNNTAVTVITDKMKYERGEVVKVILTNNLGQSIFSHMRSGTPVFCIAHIERKTQAGNWENLYAQCQYPHCIYDIDVPGEIKPGENATMVWQSVEFVNGTAVSAPLRPGIYRLLISYEDHLKTEWKSAYTNEFTIL